MGPHISGGNDQKRFSGIGPISRQNGSLARGGPLRVRTKQSPFALGSWQEQEQPVTGSVLIACRSNSRLGHDRGPSRLISDSFCGPNTEEEEEEEEEEDEDEEEGPFLGLTVDSDSFFYWAKGHLKNLTSNCPVIFLGIFMVKKKKKKKRLDNHEDVHESEQKENTPGRDGKPNKKKGKTKVKRGIGLKQNISLTTRNERTQPSSSLDATTTNTITNTTKDDFQSLFNDKVLLLLLLLIGFCHVFVCVGERGRFYAVSFITLTGTVDSTDDRQSHLYKQDHSPLWLNFNPVGRWAFLESVPLNAIPSWATDRYMLNIPMTGDQESSMGLNPHTISLTD
ncbi:hypothetical protein M0802_010908 [Mischocyttarus mexicanus]|nr:hypothetical protein M0802_010908 [Mischocyttarus mexicanus]